MLSDEEKKAIEYFKSNLEMTKEMGKKWGFQEEIKNNEIILNLIEKQSKEIEEAEQKEKRAYIDGTNVAHELCNKMWKNKIKAKIEELEKDLKEYENGQEWEIQDEIRGQIDVLQSLLEKE